MAVLILVRHGRTAANAQGILAGWSPGIGLDDKGLEQVDRVGHRLAATPLAAVVASPLERCQQTAEALLAAQQEALETGRWDSPRSGDDGKSAARGAALEATTSQGGGTATSQPRGIPVLQTEDGIGECHYGAWTGRKLKELAAEPLWKDIQERPSTVSFPPHDDYEAESMQHMQDRSVRAILEWDQRIEEEHGPGAVWAAVSHGDIIKALVAWSLGSPLDRFQRIVIDPASVSIVRHATERPFVLRVNDTGSDPVDLRSLSEGLATPPSDGTGGDAAVGGGAGTD